MREHWLRLARHSPLGIVADLDGTLVPFAPTPAEARPTPELVALLRDLAGRPGVHFVVASGRRRADLEGMFAGAPELCLFAEHGGRRRVGGAWQATLQTGEPSAVAALAGELERLAALHPGALVERKEESLAAHARSVASAHRAAWHEAVEAAVAPWLAAHPGYARLDGAEVVEIRPDGMRKSLAVDWLRRRAGPELRIVALGDDTTDEDTFAALDPADAAVRVGPPTPRASLARWTLPDPAAAVDLLRWLAAVRAGAEPGPAAPLPEPARTSP